MIWEEKYIAEHHIGNYDTAGSLKPSYPDASIANPKSNSAGMPSERPPVERDDKKLFAGPRIN